MMELMILTVAFLALAFAAPRWGVDSTDGVDSQEWQRRREYFYPHRAAAVRSPLASRMSVRSSIPARYEKP